MIYVSIRRREDIERQRNAQGRRPYDDEGRVRVMQLQAKDTNNFQKPPEARKEAWSSLPQNLWKGPTPLTF